MLMEIETEHKFIVDGNCFKDILYKCNKKLPLEKNVSQINYYYDTENNNLNKSNITVRVRQNEEKIKLQIKNHKSVKENFLKSEEYNLSVKKLPNKIVINSNVLNNVKTTVFLKGSLCTKRKVYAFGSTGEICFDTNMYLGKCDYEIEFEFKSQDKLLAADIIRYLGLVYHPIKSKSRRFFEELEKVKNEQSYTAVL